MDCTKTLTEKTDEQLYDMLARGADYTPEALAAARVEIQRRNLNPALVAELEIAFAIDSGSRSAGR